MILLALATGVLGLQFYCLGRSDFLRPFRLENNADRFVDRFAEDQWRRLCTQMLHLNDRGSLQILSGAVCEDEILLIVKNVIFSRSRFHSELVNLHELWRIDCKTGRVIDDRISPESLSLVSDGHEVEILKSDSSPLKNIRDSEHSSPFLWDGRPFIIVKHDADGLYQFFKFTEWSIWTGLDQYLLLPGITNTNDFQIKSVSIAADKTEIHLDVSEYQRHVVYSLRNLSIGTFGQAKEFSQQHNVPFIEFSKKMTELGWRRLEYKSNSLRQRNVFGIWMHDIDINSIDAQFQDDLNLTNPVVSSFQLLRHRNGETVESRSIKVPSSIAREGVFSFNTESFLTFTSSDGDPYFAWVDDFNRLRVMTLQNDQLRVIAQYADLRSVLHLLIAARDYTCCVFFPSLVLGMCAWIVEAYRRRSSPRISVAEAELASTVRRGLARTIDLAILAFIFTTALVLHLDAIRWTTSVSESATDYVPEVFRGVSTGLNWSRFRDLQEGISHLLLEIVSPPLVWWVAVPGYLFLLAHIIWQGRTGQTLGKWLVGIRVVRSDGRRCGIPRSLLRELLLAVDSLLLLSWIPGVISIFATTRSQRLGDLAADTVVVRVRPKTDLTNDRSNIGAEPSLVR